MTEKLLDLNDIKVLPNRIRTNKEKKSEMEKLKESIKLLGLFHPILVNEVNELIAGFRRLTAFKELKLEIPGRFDKIPVRILTSADEYKTLLAEIHENWARKEMKGYELDIGFTRAKKLYQKLYPKTVRGTTLKRGKDDPNIKAETTSRNGGTPKREKSVPRFEEFLAQEIGTKSVATIEKRIRVGNAIERGVYTENEVQEYKDDKVSHTKMLKVYEGREKLDKQLIDSIKKEAKKVETFKKEFIPKKVKNKTRVNNIRNFKLYLKSLLPKEYNFSLKINERVKQKYIMTMDQLREFLTEFAGNDGIWEAAGEPEVINITMKRIDK